MPVIKPFIHKNVPPRLKTAYRRAKNLRGEGYKIHILAKSLDVNLYYLYELLKKGKEPNDTTEKLREVRHRMFLPRKKRAPKHETSEPKPIPAYMYWWTRVLDQDTRHGIIRQAWVQLNSFTGNKQRKNGAKSQSRPKSRTTKKARS